MNTWQGTDGNDHYPDPTQDNSGDDSLWGLGGNDVIDGGNGNDIIQGGSGADTLFGGAGIDEISYVDSGAGVAVNLTALTATGGDATGDVIHGDIESISGSVFNDTLTGSAAANTIWGDAGNDVISGLGGNDTLTGYTGD
uniref:calcium-binding protein n=1 Tax=Inquilinus sp. TaxID=1932117 RepID=UPI0031E3F031